VDVVVRIDTPSDDVDGIVEAALCSFSLCERGRHLAATCVTDTDERDVGHRVPFILPW
jgi:hypothetical protein